MTLAEKYMYEAAHNFRHLKDVKTADKHADQLLYQMCSSVASRNKGDDLEDLYQVWDNQGEAMKPTMTAARGLLYSCDYWNYLDCRIDYIVGRDWDSLKALINVMRREMQAYESGRS